MTRSISARITPTVGKRAKDQYDVVLSGYPKNSLRYLRLSQGELTAIQQAVPRLTVGDKRVRQMVAAERAGAEQGVLL